MEEISENPIGKTDSFDHEFCAYKKMKGGVSRSRMSGDDSKEGVSIGNKTRGRCGSQTRREPGTSNSDRRGRHRDEDSCNKAIIPYSRNEISGHGDSGGVTKVKVGLKHDLFCQLHGELRVHEEDTRIMKKAIVEFVEERSKLITEVTQQFDIVKERLKNGSRASQSLSVVNPHRDKSKVIGLSQILDQDSIPSLVTRDFKVNLDASQGLAGILRWYH